MAPDRNDREGLLLDFHLNRLDEEDRAFLDLHRDILAANNTDQFWRDFNELIIVPDGLVWYAPFEALQVTTGDGFAGRE